VAVDDRIVELRDLEWPFGGKPCVRPGGWHTYVDPFPCYAHPVGLVRETLELVESHVDVVCKPTYYVLHNEPSERTNGWATTRSRYPRDEDHPWDGIVVLCGKRIPLHPAMTRYLTSHEYGHHAEYEALRRRGKEAHDNDVRDEYRKLRGLPAKEPAYYGGRTWHLASSEVFANDFRVLICGVEEEFWPHEAPHPMELSNSKRAKLRAWWEREVGVK